MLVICSTCLLKLALKKKIFLKFSYASTNCLYYYGLRKSNRRLKSELHKQQYTVTLYGCNHQAHVIHVVIWQMQKFMSYCTAFAFFYIEFDGNQVPSTRPGRLYLEGRFIGGFYALRFWGAYLEGRIHGGAYFRNCAVDMERFQTV